MIKLKLPLIVFIIVMSCNTNTVQEKELDYDISFNKFYEKFVMDRSFQLSRIKFPLKGKYLDGETISLDDTASNLDYTWNRDNWDLIKKVEKLDESLYNFKQIETDTLVVRKIEGKGVGFKFEETYKKIDHKWYLVYLVSFDL